MKFAPLLTAALSAGMAFGTGAIAQAGEFYAGVASNGEPIYVDTDSLARAGSRSVNFVYYLGDDRVFAQANCSAGSWTTFPERQVNYPQSRATQRMLSYVCRTGLGGGAPNPNRSAFVIDPPSNVRQAPNGNVICSLPRRRINTYGAVGSWYRTDACGRMGFIHASQIEF